MVRNLIFPPEQENARKVCCNQVIATTTFMSQQTKPTFNVIFKLTVKWNILFI